MDWSVSVKGHALKAQSYTWNDPHRGYNHLLTVRDLIPSTSIDQAQYEYALAQAANAAREPHHARRHAQASSQWFQKAGKPIAKALAQWQAIVLLWTQPDFGEAIGLCEHLYTDLEGKITAKTHAYIGLTLASGFLHNPDHHGKACNLLARTSDVLQTDALGQAQIALLRSSLYRRQEKYDDAHREAVGAIDLFSKQGASLGTAHAFEHEAWIYHATQEPQIAIEWFQKAIVVYQRLNIPLRTASAATGLGYQHNTLGNYTEAMQAFNLAEPFERYKIKGASADNDLNRGMLELNQGNLADALKFTEKAENGFKEVNVTGQLPLVLQNKAECLRHLNRYQEALAVLEELADVLKNDPHAEQKYANNQLLMASVYDNLNQTQKAEKILTDAYTFFQTNQLDVSTFKAIFLLAKSYMHQAKPASAIELLQQALSHHTLRPQWEMRFRRLLLYAFLAEKNAKAASEHLPFLTSFHENIVSPVEYALSHLAVGDYYEQTGDLQKAKLQWQLAIDNTYIDLPALIWQAESSLAPHSEPSLPHYVRAVRALSQLQRRFTQPQLYTHLVEKPHAFFEEAIDSALSDDSAESAAIVLQFIEAGKAQVGLQLLAYSAGNNPDLSHLQNLQYALQIEKKRLFRDEQTATVQEWAAFRTQEQAYKSVLEKVMRQKDRGFAIWDDLFEEEVWRKRCSAELPSPSWIALNYYQRQDDIICAILTPHDTLIETIPFDHKLKIAIETCTDLSHPPDLTPRNKVALGKLIPPQIWQAIAQAPHQLIISPHNTLHNIPWGVLQQSADTLPLLSHPHTALSMTPSLQTLQILWERKRTPRTYANAKGTFVGVGEFPATGRHPLPFAKSELTALSKTAGFDHILYNKTATWDALSKTAFCDLLHIMSHGFHDRTHPEQSGFALYDRDLWLQHIWELAPLPPLLVFSSCFGAQAEVGVGDNAIGLTPTCLTAGVNTIIGSRWPVMDESSSNVMTAFYEYLAAGLSPSQAIAEAQRQRFQQGNPDWYVFSCQGVP